MTGTVIVIASVRILRGEVWKLTESSRPGNLKKRCQCEEQSDVAILLRRAAMACSTIILNHHLIFTKVLLTLLDSEYFFII